MSVAGTPNSLTDEEKSAGWTLLFNGRNTEGWHSFKKDTFPAANWDVQDGWLHCIGKGGGDIVSQELFEQFELSWDWKLASVGNSGVKYFVVDSRGPIGHEYQLIDDDRHPDGKLAEGKRVTAAFYDVFKPSVKTPLKPPGEVNHSKIVVNGNHAEHWLNDVKVLEYELGSEAAKKAVAQSKFKEAKAFGERIPGHILLQDHNSQIWFQNIKIRKL